MSIKSFFCSVVFVCAAALAAQAAVFNVNSVLDTNDIAAGDGVCADASGNCTLRAAVQESNAAVEADTINFSLSGATTITLSLGEILITNAVSINGTGAASLTINANHASRVFNIQRTGIAVNIINLTTTNGRASNSGGCINAASGDLTLEGVTVRGCFAESGGGGGVFSGGSGVLRVSGSTFENNIVAASGAVGGGIAVSGSGSEIRRSRITGNDAPRGGGIAIGGGIVKIVETTVSGNTTAIGGGGLLVSFSAAQVIASTISGNTAQRSGGGIALPMGTVILTNSTVSGNRVLSGEGGGISTGTNGSVGYLTVRNSTVVNNQAAYAGGLTGGSATATTVGNSIIANNTADSAPNVAAIFTSLGGNLVNDRAGGEGYVPTDLPDGTNPSLGALANNGGATQTHALLAGSPAIDNGLGTVALDPDGNALTTDQRGTGFARINGASVDIGAYEYSAAGMIVTGRAMAGGRGAGGAQVVMTNLNTGETRVTITNQFGYFRFADVVEGLMYRFEVNHKRFAFDSQITMIDGKKFRSEFCCQIKARQQFVTEKSGLVSSEPFFVCAKISIFKKRL